jgi:hypothetical protein
MILLANMNRQHAALITLLQTTDASILLIQEPWWGHLVPKPSDTDKDGIKVKGTCTHPNWHTITPPSHIDSPEHHITIFIRTDITASLTYSVLSQMMSYSCIEICLDVKPPLFIINYHYHVIDHRSSLEHLIGIPLPASPLIIGRDFNTHSPCWSPPDLTTSPWAPQLKSWIECEDLLSLILEGLLTCRGSAGRPSLIDHFFVNLPFLANPFFPSTCSVSFNQSISFDHAALFLNLPLLIPPTPPPSEIGWKIVNVIK